MKKKDRRILLCVTGMSPAVVTETLYALVTQKKFIPTEIRVITTLQGKNKLLEALLGIVGERKQEKGALAEFIEDYGQQYKIQSIHFDESCIEVIKDIDGNELTDIRLPEENNLAADQIVGLVGSLCQDENAIIHASIAGGRKTMGFFLGYALSLYGREKDTLSHVLVSSEFENQRNFYYPKPYNYVIYNEKGQVLDAYHGKVMLADIPWVRLGLGLPDGLLNHKISYSDSVQKAQNMLIEPKLGFISPIDDRQVIMGKNRLKLSPRGYSLLLSLALVRKNSLSLLDNETLLNDYYLPIYRKLKGDSERMDKRLKRARFVNGKEDYIAYDSEIMKLLSESRNEIVKEVKTAFSIKRTDIPYIPYSKEKHYTIGILPENIYISDIEFELKSYL